jgi:hypothetical protein
MARWLTIIILTFLPLLAAAQPYRIYRYRPPQATGTPAAVRPAATPAVASQPAGPHPVTRAATISAPGSYVLTANLNAPDDLSTGVVVITAPNVTLDLGGFAIRGRNAGSPDACAVAVLAGNVTLRNGSISDFDRDNQCGVLIGSGVENFVVEGVSISGCETGVILNPDNADPTRNGRIEHCRVSGGVIGLLAFSSSGVTISSCEITGAAARHNLEGEGSGMLLRGDGFLVERCNLSGNAHGLRLEAQNSVVSGVVCSANRNTGMFVTGANALIRDCNASGNGIIGISITSHGCRVQSTLCSGNGGHGISLDSDGDAAARNTAVVQCQIMNNASDGLANNGAGGAFIADCHIGGNSGTGMDLKPDDVYRGNYVLGGAAPVRGGRDGGTNIIGAAQ